MIYAMIRFNNAPLAQFLCRNENNEHEVFISGPAAGKSGFQVCGFNSGDEARNAAKEAAAKFGSTQYKVELLV
jgi:hypothetical protein